MTIEQPAFSCVMMRGDTLRQVGPPRRAVRDFLQRCRLLLAVAAARPDLALPAGLAIVHHQSSATRRLPMLSAELAGSAVRFANKYFTGASRWRIRAAIVLEAAWRKLLHHDFPASLASIWRGDLFHADASKPAPAAPAVATRGDLALLTGEYPPQPGGVSDYSRAAGARPGRGRRPRRGLGAARAKRSARDTTSTGRTGVRQSIGPPAAGSVRPEVAAGI